MPNREDIAWFKQTFAERLEAALAHSAFSLDFLVALACQETGEVWPLLRRAGLDEDELLALCVGDTLDASGGRSAFPRTRAELEAAPEGARMFQIARQALQDMARYVPEYARAAQKPDKFCHGFGLYQRDLQFFRQDPPYFLQRRYARFDDTLAVALNELEEHRRRIGLGQRVPLSVLDMVAVAIAYNTGRYDPRKGLNQGYRPPGGKYYGQSLFDYLRLSETVAIGDAAPLIEPPAPGEAIVPPPSPLTASGPFLRVDTRVSTLYLRSAPRISTPPRGNVVGELPDGHAVRALDGKTVNGFIAVETSLAGALLRGWAAARYLKPAPDVQEIAVIAPPQSLRRQGDAAVATAPSGAIPAVWMPRTAGSITRRTAPANAHSLNEPGQPGRQGSTPDALRAELAAIIAWLDSEKPTHKRYQPRDGLTFCNIYSHDFCHLAGAYLPRVWWSAPALLKWQAGQSVQPLIGNTLREMRANDLFRWLRDFGPGFGWRQTGTLDKLQLAANQGALGLVVARRKEEGKSGHIVLVVPETDSQRARRDAAGNVIAPLQSQAGARNFRYGTGQAGWWNRETFAEFGFWIHA
ncbi:MAG TPA: SH3 domain-containing protein [Stenotrophomonas sp.]|nr:SH3 domain-containing protein [Stenotrophomonas sp.]